MLTISALTYRIAGREILSGASLSLPAGHKAGLIGRNGTGKTTLLKLIDGSLQPDAGTIDVPRYWRLSRLEQEMRATELSLIDCVLATDTERHALLAEVDDTDDPNRIGEIHVRLADIDAHRAEARAARILAGLGFDAAAQRRRLGDFSGGWRMRVALAAQLYSAADLLLLDEPTNHLDLEATLWLENYLKSYPGTVLLVSHDRDLLNRVVDRIVHLSQGKLTLYSGGYDDFEEARRQRLALDSATASKQEAQRRHMMAFVERFRYKASKARQAQSRLKAIERMKPIAAAIVEKGISITFPETEALAPPLITLDHVAVGYAPGKPVLKQLDFRIDPDDRIALLGSNGNGKSTLVKLLAGRLQPMAGELRRGSKIRVGYFAQHQTEELDLSVTPIQTMAHAAPGLLPERRRAHLGRFGLGEDQAGTKVDSLSGGEKARLLLALMSLKAPNLLLLDEPTNHLDIDSRQALVEAINEFSGAVILISHDPYLLELCADRLLLVKDGAVSPFAGDLDDYRRLVLAERREPRGGAAAPKVLETRLAEIKRPNEKRPKNKPRRDKQTSEEYAVAQAELALAKFTQALALIERKLADPKLYAGPAGEFTQWQAKHAEVKQKLAQAEEAWLGAQERLKE
jgi:ATP-binding cassette, subfamily F, member 3